MVHFEHLLNYKFYLTAPTYENPCNTAVCGPNSQCRMVNNQAVCSCLPTYLGIPPACRPECVANSECPQNQACMQQKCVNPCIGVCGVRAICEVFNHNPICTCPLAHSGDPFTQCTFIASKCIVLLFVLKYHCIIKYYVLYPKIFSYMSELGGRPQ